VEVVEIIVEILITLQEAQVEPAAADREEAELVAPVLVKMVQIIQEVVEVVAVILADRLQQITEEKVEMELLF
jgi:hypothetical protein